MSVSLNIPKRFLLRLRPSKNIDKEGAGGDKWGPAEQPVQGDAGTFNANDKTLFEVIKVPLTTLEKFASTCEWLIYVSDLLFAVPGTVNIQNGNQWTEVNSKTPLSEGIYRFMPSTTDSKTVHLTRYFSGANIDVPVPPDHGTAANDFTQMVKYRESFACLISRLYKEDYPAVCSHLIPARLGPYVVQNILRRRIADLPDWAQDPNHGEYDYRVGVHLFRPYDKMLSGFTMGFYKPNADAEFKIHQFEQPDVPQDLATATGWSNIGLRWDAFSRKGWTLTDQQVATSNLHNSIVEIQDNVGTFPLLEAPPAEVISWHYLQCVLKAWKAADYTSYENIAW